MQVLLPSESPSGFVTLADQSVVVRVARRNSAK